MGANYSPEAVFNQPPPLENYNLFDSDQALKGAVWREGDGRKRTNLENSSVAWRSLIWASRLTDFRPSYDMWKRKSFVENRRFAGTFAPFASFCSKGLSLGWQSGLRHGDTEFEQKSAKEAKVRADGNSRPSRRFDCSRNSRADWCSRSVGAESL